MATDMEEGNRRDMVGEAVAPRTRPRGLGRAIAARFGLGAPLTDQERMALLAAGGSDNASQAYGQSLIQQEQQARDRSIQDKLTTEQSLMADLQARQLEQRIATGAIKEIAPGMYFDLQSGKPVDIPPEMAAAAQKYGGSASQGRWIEGPTVRLPDGGMASTARHSVTGEVRTNRLEGKLANDPFVKQDAEKAGELNDVIDNSRKRLSNLNTATALIENTDVPFGPGAATEIGLRKAYKRLGDAIGFDISDEEIQTLAAADQLASIFTQESLRFVNETKGAVSDRETAMFQRAAPNFGNTREGNLLVMGMAKLSAQRDLERSRFIRRQLDKGMSYVDAEEAFAAEIANRNDVEELLKKHGFNPETGELENQQATGTTLNSSTGRITFKRIDN